MKKRLIFVMIALIMAFSFSYKTYANDEAEIYLESKTGVKTTLLKGKKNVVSIDYESYYSDFRTSIKDAGSYTENLLPHVNSSKLKVKMSGLFNLEYEVDESGNEIKYEAITQEDFYIFIDGVNQELYIRNKKVESGAIKLRILITPTHKPALSGEDYLVNNVDTPYTVEEIKNAINLKATDAYDGDITKSITVKSDTYTPNNKKVGSFEIVFTVKNSANLTADYRLTINNMDLKAPVINGALEKTISYKKVMTNEEVISYFTVSDNYDKDVLLKVVTTNYEKNQVGTFTYKLEAKDSSGNSTKVDFVLKVIDDVVPVFNDLNTGVIKINFKEEINAQRLMLDLKATDEIDGDLTSKIIIKENNIIKKLGTYKVIYEVKDKAGNVATYERSYEVITLDIPVFWVSESVLTIENINYLSIEQIVLVVGVNNEIDIKDYIVTNDTYSENYSNSGIYNVSFKITDTNDQEYNISQNIRVFDNNDLPILSNDEKIYKSIFIIMISLVSIFGLFVIGKKLKRK